MIPQPLPGLFAIRGKLATLAIDVDIPKQRRIFVLQISRLEAGQYSIVVDLNARSNASVNPFLTIKTNLWHDNITDFIIRRNLATTKRIYKWSSPIHA